MIYPKTIEGSIYRNTELSKKKKKKKKKKKRGGGGETIFHLVL